MSNVGLTRRTFLKVNLAGVALASLVAAPGMAHADPQSDDAEWIANHVETRLLGADGQPIVGLPPWTRMRIMRGFPNGQIQVWVPRFNLVGRVAVDTIGPVPAPSPAELAAEKLDGPTSLEAASTCPGRVMGGGNLRTWPGVGQPPLRTLGHNAPVRVLDSVEGDDGDEWYRANWLDGVTATRRSRWATSTTRSSDCRACGTRPPRPTGPTRPGRHFEADLKEPALLTAFEDGAPIWSTLTLKGTVSNRTPSGVHKILWRVPNETMTSERVYPPIPRDAPGGYYLKNVLFTQYFTSDGASIHYNYWSSNWGYAGSHGCLGVAYNEAKFAWDWAEVGTPVYVFT